MRTYASSCASALTKADTEGLALRPKAPKAGIEAPFPMDDFTRFRLLEGLDDIGLTLRHAADISAYEARTGHLRG